MSNPRVFLFCQLTAFAFSLLHVLQGKVTHYSITPVFSPGKRGDERTKFASLPEVAGDPVTIPQIPQGGFLTHAYLIALGAPRVKGTA